MTQPQIEGPKARTAVGIAVPVVVALIAVQLFANVTADIFTSVMVAAVAYAAGRFSR